METDIINNQLNNKINNKINVKSNYKINNNYKYINYIKSNIKKPNQHDPFDELNNDDDDGGDMMIG